MSNQSKPSTAVPSSAKKFVLPMVALVVFAYFVSKLIGSGLFGGSSSAPMTPEAIADRLSPIGTVALGAAASQGPRTGEAVYKSICAACHDAGAAGAPKTGDVGAWAPRLAQGFDTLVKHATDGFNTMPARGGNPSLPPLEVARAVAYLGNQSGAKFKEPDAPAK